MRYGARDHEQSELRPVGDESELGSLRASAADGGRAGRADDLQHRQHASAVRDSHARDPNEHPGVRPGGIGDAARVHAERLAARSPGHLPRRQRNADAPARHAAHWRALLERRPLRRAPDCLEWMGPGIDRAAHDVAMERTAVRLRVVDSDARRTRRCSTHGAMAASSSSWPHRFVPSPW